MKIKPVVIIIPVVIALVALIGGSVLVWQLFLFSLLMFVLGYLWALINIRGVDIRVKNPPEYSRVGDWFEEEITVTNNSITPKFGITVSGISDLPGYGNSLSLNLPSENSHSWQSRIFCLRRGLYTLGTVNVSASDPLGLVTLNRVSGEDRKLLVFPETLALPFFEPDTYTGTEYGTGRWLRSGTSSTIGQVREYSSGDTLNHVHWPSTAHIGTLMVKVFEPDQMRHQSRNIWLVANMHREDHLGTGVESTEDYTVTITSSILNKYLDSAKETGLLMSGDRRYVFTPGTGDEFGYRTDEALARVSAYGREPLSRLLAEENNRFQRDSVVIIVTPSTEDSLISAVHDLRNRGCLVVLVLIDSASFGGTTGSLKSARDLSIAGAQVYIVRKGDDIARVLDSRHVSSPLMYGE